MKTLWGEQLNPEQVLREYPRPQLRRAEHHILNGLWDYAITESDQPPKRWDGQILVPFSPEAELSGVNRTLLPGQYLWYRRKLELKPGDGQRLLLHFGAVDQIATVYLNGASVGGHTGGYTAFTIDLTAEATSDDELLVRVRDDSDESPLARGKQKTKRGGIWYTPQSGIWQTVWAELVPERYIKNLESCRSLTRAGWRSRWNPRQIWPAPSSLTEKPTQVFPTVRCPLRFPCSGPGRRKPPTCMTSRQSWAKTGWRAISPCGRWR